MDILTYSELSKEIKAFDNGGIKLMILEGEGGLGKTWLAEVLTHMAV